MGHSLTATSCGNSGESLGCSAFVLNLENGNDSGMSLGVARIK